jgi:hypothetical protein
MAAPAAVGPPSHPAITVTANSDIHSATNSAITPPTTARPEPCTAVSGAVAATAAAGARPLQHGLGPAPAHSSPPPFRRGRLGGGGGPASRHGVGGAGAAAAAGGDAEAAARLVRHLRPVTLSVTARSATASEARALFVKDRIGDGPKHEMRNRYDLAAESVTVTLRLGLTRDADLTDP